MSSVQRRMATGAAWMFAARWVDKLLGLVSTLVLARLLMPEDFGIVAFAMAIVALLEIMTNFGFDSALIQHQAPDRQHYDTVWSISLIFGGAVAALLVAVSVPMATWFADPRMTAVVLVIAVSVVVGSFRNVGCVDFRRNLEFHKEFLLSIYRRVLTVPVTIGLAFWLQSYWALVLGSLFSAAIGTMLTFMMHPFRPRWSLVRVGELFGFSKWLFLSNLCQFVSLRSPELVIGKFRGPHELGLFSLANEFGSLPSTEIVAPINRAAFPGYSRLAGMSDELKYTFMRVIGLIALIVFPSGVGLALIAPIFVPVVLGEKWLEAITLLQLCALAALQIGMWTNTSYLYVSMGRPRVGLVLSAIQAVATVSFLMLFVLTDTPDAAGWALLAAAGTLIGPNLYLWRYDLGVRWPAIAGVVWRPVLGCIIMISTFDWLDLVERAYTTGVGGVLSLFCLMAIGAAAYVISVGGAWWLAGRPMGAESIIVAGATGYARARLSQLRT